MSTGGLVAEGAVGRGLSPGVLAWAAGAGCLHAWSLAVPGLGQPVWGLQLVALGWLVDRLRGVATRDAAQAPAGWVRAAARGALLAWVFATSALAATFWWLFISMHVYGGLAAPLAVAAVGALAGGLALYYALAGAVVSVCFWRFPGMKWSGAALIFAAAWTLAELARGRLLTGFPWGAGGYAHVDGPLAGYAPWLGVYGMGALAAVVATLLAGAIRAGRGGGVGTAVRLLAGVAAVALLPMASPAFTRSAGEMSVALLQGNIEQGEKFEPARGIVDALQWYGERLRDSRASLVVAPETALPLLPEQLPPGYFDALERRFAEGEQAALIGLPLGNPVEGYTNSALGLAPGRAQPYRYDKHHLVPFGEFIPPMFRWFVDLMHIPLGDFRRGPLQASAFEWEGQRLAPNICYEDLFGEELAVRFARADAAPTALVNLSNIAWFGDTVALAQHLQISRLRALELERPMLRATNTGVTAVIDHRGRVQAMLEPLTRGVLEARFDGRVGRTPYARWVAAWGLWPLALVCFGVLLAVALWGRRARGVA